jgi:fructokinase
MNKKYTVVGIGEVLWDVFPDKSTFGGAPANVACMVAGLNSSETEAFIISAVGDDDLGGRALAELQGHGVETSLLQTSQYGTGAVNISLDESRQAIYTFADNCAWDNIQWCDELLKLSQKTDALCFGSLAQRAETSRRTIQKFVESVPATAIKVFDVNLRASFYSKETLLQSLELANVLKINEEELPVLAEMLEISGEVDVLLHSLAASHELKTIVFTQGAKGSILLKDGFMAQIPTVKTEVIDTVGAGDSFTASIIIGLLKGQDLLRIGSAASKVAAHVCAHHGATPKLSEEMQAIFAPALTSEA